MASLFSKIVSEYRLKFEPLALNLDEKGFLGFKIK